jgi:hypothetical protein
MKQTLTDI